MSRRFVSRVLALSVPLALFAVPPSPVAAAESKPFRAFSADSVWNLPVPADAPSDPKSNDYINYLKSTNDADYIRLAGTESDGGWGEPVFWAEPGDPTYVVKQTRYTLPKEFLGGGVRIPAEARVPATSDAQMTIYDMQAGAVYKLQKAVYNETTDSWSAGGGSYFRLDSNGLVGLSNGSDDIRNAGTPGQPTGSSHRALGRGPVRIGRPCSEDRRQHVAPGSRVADDRVRWRRDLAGRSSSGTAVEDQAGRQPRALLICRPPRW